MHLTVSDILDVAIKSEESSYKFYQEMAGQAKDTEAAKVLTKLAQDEKDHLSYLLWLKSGYPINEQVYFDGFEEAGELNAEMSAKEVLEVAVKREGAAADIYRKMADIFKAEPDKCFIFERMAREEEHHAKAVSGMLEQL